MAFPVVLSSFASAFAADAAVSVGLGLMLAFVGLAWRLQMPAAQLVAKAPETAGTDALLDNAALLAHAGRDCDMALSSQFDELDGHCAAVLQDVDQQDGRAGRESQAADEAGCNDHQRTLTQLLAEGTQSSHATQRCSDNFQASIESHCSQHLEDLCDAAMDAQYAKSLELLQMDLEGLDAYDCTEPDTDTSFLERVEDELTRQADQMFEMEINASLSTEDFAYEGASDNDHDGPLRESEGVNQEVPCVNLLAMAIEGFRNAGGFLIWAI